MRILLAIPGEEDPYLPPSASTRIKGPLLSLLQQRAFDRVLCFLTRARSDIEPELRAACLASGASVQIIAVDSDVEQAIQSNWPRAAEVYVTGPSRQDPMLRSFFQPFVFLRVFVPADLLDDVLIEDVPFHGGATNRVREPRGDYAVSFDQPGLRVLPCAARSPEIVMRDVGLIGEHPAFRLEVEKAAAVAVHIVPILIQGETGTGKGVVARFIHELSDRAQGPLVAVNCGALPENLAESLLFGHVKGAFTGAHADQAGKFVLADNGTLFLDEVGELPLALQPKLLRVLEDGIVEPLGASRGRKVNVRVITATHRDLKKAILDKTFREDLYYRLSFTTIHLPPLRERRSDIPLLAAHIVNRVNRRLQKPKSLAADALQRLECQYWRGNVRDLENSIGRSMLFARTDQITAGDLQLEENPIQSPIETPEPYEGFSLETHLAQVRVELVEKSLKKTGGNQSAAARLLGLTPQAISKFLHSRNSSD